MADFACLDLLAGYGPWAMGHGLCRMWARRDRQRAVSREKANMARSQGRVVEVLGAVNRSASANHRVWACCGCYCYYCTQVATHQPTSPPTRQPAAGQVWMREGWEGRGPWHGNTLVGKAEDRDEWVPQAVCARQLIRASWNHPPGGLGGRVQGARMQ
ncbi:hypothetical protein COCMIDRAFT_21451 [Bipolaris oryzae ATCC 44560]|uniref:Uncharacterized protein n=1 Tax=Bipolaris oryzae ATCC 44560 TaxID=930090 RepID=W6ZGR6_COCMI|nr:uncharacterized protein COCMIDRAFT_21451 [Bipolaris oryzae ATCC 44560]EUC51052.1 hypothetical protein COCMIDRAFT_21451 [Bipolaris oryzae ATCC 44560]